MSQNSNNNSPSCPRHINDQHVNTTHSNDSTPSSYSPTTGTPVPFPTIPLNNTNENSTDLSPRKQRDKIEKFIQNCKGQRQEKVQKLRRMESNDDYESQGSEDSFDVEGEFDTNSTHELMKSISLHFDLSVLPTLPSLPSIPLSGTQSNISKGDSAKNPLRSSSSAGRGIRITQY
jgi:hypothetical protein